MDGTGTTWLVGPARTSSATEIEVTQLGRAVLPYPGFVGTGNPGLRYSPPSTLSAIEPLVGPTQPTRTFTFDGMSRINGSQYDTRLVRRTSSGQFKDPMTWESLCQLTGARRRSAQ
jgi:hypothetical protein